MDGLLAHMFSLTVRPVAQPRFHTRVIYLCVYISGLSVHHVHLGLGFGTLSFFLKGKKQKVQLGEVSRVFLSCLVIMNQHTFTKKKKCVGVIYLCMRSYSPDYRDSLL